MPERDANQLAADETEHRSSSDYIDRTIETVRNHREADNCWPQWANIFADEIEDLRTDRERLVALVGTLQQERDTLLRNIKDEAVQTILWKDNWSDEFKRAEAAEAALATTRQALTEIAAQKPDGTAARAVQAARNALADTGGDTA